MKDVYNILGLKEDLVYLFEKNLGKISGFMLCIGVDDFKFVYEILGNLGGSRYICLICFLIVCWLVVLLCILFIVFFFLFRRWRGFRFICFEYGLNSINI